MAEDVMDAVALLPWWAGVVLALASYLVLHRLAVPPAVTAAGPTPDLITRTVVSGVAMAGQYIAPLLCCAGALFSALRRRRRAGLLDRATQGDAAVNLSALDWREFELLVGEAYRLAGYRVSETGGGGADGGVDLVLHRGDKQVLVQCKHWRDFRIGVGVVRELVGVMTARGAAGGIVVTGGEFTPDARAFAATCKVELVNGEALVCLLRRAQVARDAGKTLAPSREPVRPAAAPAPVTQAPACLACHTPMVRRMARKGQNAGLSFWGCARYPACRGTR